MARKQLIPGENARRLAARVAATPPDETVFSAIKPEEIAPAQGERDFGFSRQEIELIMKSCIDYRNHLPCYLRSVQHELKLIASIIRKCERNRG
jgi:hypothetical protein